MTEMLDRLANDGWAFGDGLVPEAEWREWSAWLDANAALLRPARIGREAGLQTRREIRGDSIFWIEDDDLSPVASDVRRWLETLRRRLNRDLTLGLRRFEAHFALYPPGTGYDAHVDQPDPNGPRKITFVLYLNDAWSNGDGGELAMHVPDSANAPRIIEPLGGRLVLFRSERFPHAVRAAHRSRKSLTGWFRDDDVL